MTSESADGSGSPSLVADDTDQWWERSRKAWHALFAVVVVACVFVLRADDAPRWAYAVLAALGCWYLALGASAVHRARQGPAHPRLYLVGAAVATAWLGYADGNALVLLFAIYPQVFALTKNFREAVLGAAALSLSAAVALAASGGWSGAAVASAAVSSLVNFAFALVIGGIIEVLLREMDRRGALLDQVTCARDKAAAAQHEAGVMAERERLSREIHDTLAQGFTSILMLAQAADATAEDPAAVRARLAGIERTARENLAEARALVAALEPVDLQGATLSEALGRLVDRFGAELDVEADLTVRGVPHALDPHRQVVLVRAAQEGLANVRKHAGSASRVRVLLEFLPDGATRLRVTDDGCGLVIGDEGRPAAAGSGLRGMRARVEPMGGRVRLEPAGAAAGATLDVLVP